MSLDEQLAGNAYAYRESSDTLRIARPDFMTIVLGCRSQRTDFAVGIGTFTLDVGMDPDGFVRFFTTGRPDSQSFKVNFNAFYPT